VIVAPLRNVQPAGERPPAAFSRSGGGKFRKLRTAELWDNHAEKELMPEKKHPALDGGAWTFLSKLGSWRAATRQ
jgi:hypothetical protein